jgi:hypothetical protein
VADIQVGERISAYVFDWRNDAGTVTGITAASLTITFPPTGDFATFAITAETEFSGGRPSVGDDVTVFYRRDGEQNIATRVVVEITV